MVKKSKEDANASVLYWSGKKCNFPAHEENLSGFAQLNACLNLIDLAMGYFIKMQELA